MQVNKLRATLKSGGIALGTLMWETQGRGVLHTLAQAGMDFVMICTEHSAYNLETVVNLVAHAHAAGITPIVRIPDLQYQYVTRMLDTGCQSLIVPHVRTGEEVRRFIQYAKYHPEGRRGIATAGAINRPENAKAVIDTGAQFLLYGTDLVMIRREAERAAQAIAPFRRTTK